MAQSKHLFRSLSLTSVATDFLLRGLVILGPGAAQLSPAANKAADELYKKGIPTIAVPRPVTGSGMPDPYPGSVYVLLRVDDTQ